MANITRKDLKTFATNYLTETARLVASLDARKLAEVIEIMRNAGDRGKCIYAVGNGGSASTASHFISDMGKGASFGKKQRFKVISLTDNVEWITALANDLSYENIFVEQLRNYAELGDVLLALSASGNSENVLRAVRYADKVGCKTIGFSGFGGGKLKDLVQLSIVANSDHMGHVEDAHMVLQHIVCYFFMKRI